MRNFQFNFSVKVNRTVTFGLNSILFDQSLLHNYKIIEVGSDSKREAYLGHFVEQVDFTIFVNGMRRLNTLR